MTPMIYGIFAISIASGLLTVWSSRSERRRQFVQDRLRALTQGESSAEAPRQSLQRSLRTLSVLPEKLRVRLDAALEATGNSIRLLHLPIASMIVAIIVVAFVSKILALNLALVWFFGLSAALVAPITLIRAAQVRYQRRFLDVFPDALDLVGRGVKVGLPVNEALAVAGAEIAHPVGHELRRALDQVQLGVQMIDALNETADRVRIADFRFMVVALALQQKTGGSLAETLGNLSDVIRARKALRLKARSLTAEAKVSAAVLALLPFVVSGAMWLMNRDLMHTLFFDPRGRFMVGVAFLSLLTGLTTMYVMVKRAVR